MPPKGAKSRKPKRASPRTVTPGSGSRFRLCLRFNLLETTLGPVTGQSLTYPISAGYKAFSRFKVIRVGIEVAPSTYLEFVVRMTPAPTIDTRGELVRQADCIKYKNLQHGSWTKWFRPMTPRALGWQNTTNGQFEVDMYFYFTGLNNLLDGANGILGNVVIDVEFDGLTLG